MIDRIAKIPKSNGNPFKSEFNIDIDLHPPQAAKRCCHPGVGEDDFNLKLCHQCACMKLFQFLGMQNGKSLQYNICKLHGNSSFASAKTLFVSGQTKSMSLKLMK